MLDTPGMPKHLQDLLLPTGPIFETPPPAILGLEVDARSGDQLHHRLEGSPPDRRHQRGRHLQVGLRLEVDVGHGEEDSHLDNLSSF